MPQVPFSVPNGWAGTTARRRFNAALVIFSVLSGLTFITIITGDNWKTSLGGGIAFALLAFMSWAMTNSGRASSKPPRIASAVVMTRAITPPPDDWVHFVKFRPVPWSLVATFAILGLGCLGAGAFIAQSAALPSNASDSLIIWAMAAGAAGLGLFFVVAAIRSIITQAKGTGWPRLHGLTLGEHGIAYRLVGGESTEIAWEEITGIAATFVTRGGARHSPIPVLHIESLKGNRDYNVRILDASPIVTHAALQFYWRNAELRHELGTTSATERMAAWLAAIAPAAPPAPVSPGRA